MTQLLIGLLWAAVLLVSPALKGEEKGVRNHFPHE